jgi:hypothetical protein
MLLALYQIIQDDNQNNLQKKRTHQLPFQSASLPPCHRHRWMSSHAHYRCSDEPAARECESLKTQIYPNHRDRRKGHIYNLFIKLFQYTAQLLALPVAALCAIIIQTYTPVPAQSSSPDQSTHLLDFLAGLEIIRRWAEDNMGTILQSIPWNKTLERATVGASTRLTRFILTSAQTHISTYVSEFSIPELISDPPPPLFFAACLCFAWAISFLRQSHSVDRYQDTILTGGATVGILVAAMQNNGFLMEVKGYLIWSIVLASVVSVLLHRVLSFCSCPTTKGSRMEKPAQSSDLRTRTDRN